MANELSLISTTDIQAVSDTLKKIRVLQGTIKSILVNEVDYGKIQGCGDKPTLLKPGADKIITTFGLTPTYEIITMKEDYEGNGFFTYTIKCNLSKNDIKISEGLGQANSKEKKWAYEYVYEKDLPKGTDKELLKSKKITTQNGTYYKYEIQADACSKANTILKMAEKRAKVDAVLSFANLSEIFTQDFDDLPEEETPTTAPIVEKAKKQAEEVSEYTCEECGKGITEKVYKYSTEKLGKALCVDCQNSKL